MTSREQLIQNAFAEMGLGTDQERGRFRDLSTLGQASSAPQALFVRISFSAENAFTESPSTEEAQQNAKLA